MNRYELTYIIDTGLEETARKELIEKISQLIAANGGEVEKIDETWGKRRLAYAINYKTEGWYVLVTLKAPAALPARSSVTWATWRPSCAICSSVWRKSAAM